MVDSGHAFDLLAREALSEELAMTVEERERAGLSKRRKVVVSQLWG